MNILIAAGRWLLWMIAYMLWPDTRTLKRWFKGFVLWWRGFRPSVSYLNDSNAWEVTLSDSIDDVMIKSVHIDCYVSKGTGELVKLRVPSIIKDAEQTI